MPPLLAPAWLWRPRHRRRRTCPAQRPASWRRLACQRKRTNWLVTSWCGWQSNGASSLPFGSTLGDLPVLSSRQSRAKSLAAALGRAPTRPGTFRRFTVQIPIKVRGETIKTLVGSRDAQQLVCERRRRAGGGRRGCDSRASDRADRLGPGGRPTPSDAAVPAATPRSNPLQCAARTSGGRGVTGFAGSGSGFAERSGKPPRPSSTGRPWPRGARAALSALARGMIWYQ